MRKIIGIGETILDVIFKDNQPYRAVPGGSVFNAMVSLARLGVETNFVSEMGNDRVGNIISRFMEDNRMTTDYIDRFPDGKSPVSLAFLNDKNDAEYVFYKDYPQCRLEVAFPKIEKDDLFLFGSFYSLNPVLRSRMCEFLDYARERKAIIYYDPNFRKVHANESIRLAPTVLENLEYADIVRGSDEDFLNLFGKKDMERVYADNIRYYCRNLITTHGTGGVNIFTDRLHKHYETAAIQPVSTIGAGDNFNAGILFGLLKQNISRDDLPSLDETAWREVIRCGMELSAHVCLSYDNYISSDFASSYQG